MLNVLPTNHKPILYFSDLTERELLVFSPLLILIFFFGLIPASFSN
jgi:NADH:ubiquinone oxidoreductase subunit 4 (subunit M)